jgi:hypothetical protein
LYVSQITTVVVAVVVVVVVVVVFVVYTIYNGLWGYFSVLGVGKYTGGVRCFMTRLSRKVTDVVALLEVFINMYRHREINVKLNSRAMFVRRV